MQPWASIMEKLVFHNTIYVFRYKLFICNIELKDDVSIQITNKFII